MRKTKIICTIGPKTSSYEAIEEMAEMGMDIARLNFSHGTHEWHQKVIKAIKTINSKGKYSIAIMLDTKGAEVRSGDVKEPIELKKGEKFTFTVKQGPVQEARKVEISYDGFVKEAKEGDIILIDGGILSFRVDSVSETDIVTEVLEGGILTSRRHVNIRGKSAKLPTITKEDWEDIKFGIKEGIDFISLSFVKNAKAIKELKKYLQKEKAYIDVIAKIESAEAVPHLDGIIKESEGVMVARGDLGAEVPLEEVPILQEGIVRKCLVYGRPVIIATHLLESMISSPTPTRAEVSDIAKAIEQEADAIMLSAETATGEYPFKAISVMDRVAKRIEAKMVMEKSVQIMPTSDPRIEMVRSAATLANNLNAAAILVFTRRGFTAANMSWSRPKSAIFAFTNMTSVRRRLNFYWGVMAYRIEFSSQPEKTIQTAIELLRRKEQIRKNDMVIVVSDILVGKEHVDTVQIRKIG